MWVSYGNLVRLLCRDILIIDSPVRVIAHSDIQYFIQFYQNSLFSPIYRIIFPESKSFMKNSSFNPLSSTPGEFCAKRYGAPGLNGISFTEKVTKEIAATGA